MVGVRSDNGDVDVDRSEERMCDERTLHSGDNANSIYALAFFVRKSINSFCRCSSRTYRDTVWGRIRDVRKEGYLSFTVSESSALHKQFSTRSNFISLVHRC